MRLIDADALCEGLVSNHPVVIYTMAEPTVDAVPVVRCKDCKHYYYADNRIPQEQRYVCDLDGDRWKADSFCSFAERRTDGEIH